ncbi:hypothetical protein IV500_06680 [Paeniglutamicibacter antarcticus]|uniref:Uncharacterized protein n=1 Tax=Arthrobacter terrae TaxID=2935737 RepID=A0A931CIS4_9MICC|nr:hypothetical protein [Arthrobacter terrae]MBG0739083.1 hypothetical protein [Arthrobacter terrae]
MSNIQYVDPVKTAQDNLDEANRQLAQAQRDHSKGAIDQHRLTQIEDLRQTAAQDLQRVMKES